MDVTGLFPDKETTKLAEQAMKETWHIMSDDFVAQFRPLWEPVVKDLFSALIGHVPIKRIFPAE